MSTKHWRHLIQDQKYLGAWDLEVDGKYVPKTVTIENIYVGQFTSQGGTEDKPFAKLKEFSKPMVLQIENFKRLEKFFGDIDWKSYIGKQIVLNVEKVKFRGDIVDALRFSTRPLPAKTKPKFKDENIPGAIKMINDGKSTLQTLETQYDITEEQKEKITAGLA